MRQIQRFQAYSGVQLTFYSFAEVSHFSLLSLKLQGTKLQTNALSSINQNSKTDAKTSQTYESVVEGVRKQNTAGNVVQTNDLEVVC